MDTMQKDAEQTLGTVKRYADALEKYVRMAYDTGRRFDRQAMEKLVKQGRAEIMRINTDHPVQQAVPVKTRPDANDRRIPDMEDRVRINAKINAAWEQRTQEGRGITPVELANRSGVELIELFAINTNTPTLNIGQYKAIARCLGMEEEDVMQL